MDTMCYPGEKAKKDQIYRAVFSPLFMNNISASSVICHIFSQSVIYLKFIYNEHLDFFHLGLLDNAAVNVFGSVFLCIFK